MNLIVINVNKTKVPTLEDVPLGQLSAPLAAERARTKKAQDQGNLGKQIIPGVRFG